MSHITVYSSVCYIPPESDCNQLTNSSFKENLVLHGILATTTLASVTLLRSGSQSAKSLRLYCREAMSQFRAHVSMMLTIVLIILLIFDVCESYKGSSVNFRTANLPAALKRLRMTGGFGSSEIPKPKIITPSRGKKNSNLEKFLMMYTCKICDGRNAQMVLQILPISIAL